MNQKFKKPYKTEMGIESLHLRIKKKTGIDYINVIKTR